MEKYAIVLAAGKGTRMKTKKENCSKVSFPILNKPLVNWVLDCLRPIGFCKLITVVGFGGETTIELVKDESEVVWQKEQKGTGHAVMMTSALLEDCEGETIVCCGDTPLLTTKSLQAMFNSHEANQNDLTVMTSILSNPRGYGRIVKENGRIIKIVEQKDATEEEQAIKEINAGVYIFNNKLLFKYLKEIKPNNAQGEYYLTDVLGIFVKDGLKVDSFVVRDFDETMGVNDRYQLSIAAKKLQERINKEYMLSGVSIEDSESTFISPDVEIGPDTIIKPNTYIYGTTKIGENNIIGPGTYINNCEIGDNNEIQFSHLTDTVVKNNAVLGPYLRCRNNVVINDSVSLGNFNELKNVEVGEGSKCAHLSYLGDATIGKEVNIGCGTIIANFDGINKHHSDIKDNAFIGSGTTIISPVKIGEDSFIAAGSTINKDVEKEEFAIARSRQENKPGYAKVLKEKSN